MIQVLISLSESAYKEMCENGVKYVDYDIKQMMRDGTPLPEGAEILTAEAYSDLCLRASRIPCYLDSPCEYQNEDIKMPPPEGTIDEKTKTNVLFSFYDLAEIESYISLYIRLSEIVSGRKVPSYVMEMYKYVDSKRKELLRKIIADEEGVEE